MYPPEITYMMNDARHSLFYAASLFHQRKENRVGLETGLWEAIFGWTGTKSLNNVQAWSNYMRLAVYDVTFSNGLEWDRGRWDRGS